MNAVARIISRFRNAAGRKATLDDYNALSELFGLPTAGFRQVTSDQAFKVAVVYACTRLIAGAIAQLPLVIYDGRTRQKERNRPRLERLLNMQPCPLFSGPQFWEYVVKGILLNGDHYALIERDRSGRAQGLIPIAKDQMQVRPVGRRSDNVLLLGESGRVPVGGRLIYSVNLRGTAKNYDQDDVLHFSNFGFNGIAAPSVISSGAVGALGLHVSMEEFSRNFFDSGANQRFAIIKQGVWNEEDAKKIRSRWQDTYGKGNKTQNLPIVLDKTADLKEITINAEDSQLLQSREFEITEVARAFGLPSFMVNQEQKTTSWGQGVAEIGQVFLRHTLMPHIRRMEAEIERKLFFSTSDYIRFDTSALTRATTKERYEYYSYALGGSGKPGFMSVNEVRRAEDLPPVEGEEYDKPAAGGATTTERIEVTEDDDESGEPVGGPDEGRRPGAVSANIG